MNLQNFLEAASATVGRFLSETPSAVVSGLRSLVPGFDSYLDSAPEFAVIVLAIALLALRRRVRRTRAALGGMTAELEGLRRELTDTRQQWRNTESRVSRLLAEFTDLHSRQRSLESRLGKPDPKLAAAMSRAGTRPQHMVDCGLSHSEVHLLNALAAAKGRAGAELSRAVT